MTITRRTVLSSGAMLPALTRTPALAEAPRTDPQRLARDSGYWGKVANQYDVTRQIIQLENGYWGMMAKPVLNAHIRALERVNRFNSYYARREFPADVARVKARLAQTLGAGTDEIVLTRGATEALQCLIGGYNRLGPGDHVLYSDLDYDSMQAAMDWLKIRRGAEVVRMTIPEPATHQAILDSYDAALKADPKIRLVLVTHIGHRTGLMMPVREIVEIARRYNADVIVDAAHSWGQVNFKVDDLGADFVGFNCHKWIGAPVGAGVLYVRKARIADIDPYMTGEANSGEIESRAHTGTANFATFLALPAALDFHEAVGPANKEARLRRLRSLWTEPLRDHPGIDILTPADPRLSAGITAFRLRGKTRVEDNVALVRTLLERFGIFTVHRTGAASGACVRVTPALFTDEEDVVALRKALIGLATV